MLTMNRPATDEVRLQRSTAAIVLQLATDLAECVESEWISVTLEGRPIVSRAADRVEVPLDLEGAGASATICAGLLTGRLALGPRVRGEYSPEEMELMAKFADHFGLLLARD